MGSKLLLAGILLMSAAATAAPVDAASIAISISEPGYASITIPAPGDDSIVDSNATYGTFETTVETGVLTTDPISIDLSSTNVSTSAPGVLTVELTGYDFTAPPLGKIDFALILTGQQVTGSGGTVSLAGYVDGADTPFGMATPIGSRGPSSLASPIDYTLEGSADLTTPYSITEVLTITSTGKGSFSFDASLAAAPVPEASTWAMMLAGFGALGFAAMRRSRRQRVPATL
jgi:PEP-CTERM motif